jgi:outer membrane protein assembly factor BamB
MMTIDKQPQTQTSTRPLTEQPAQILREYGPFDGVQGVHGVTFDGERVWFAADDGLHSLDPEGGLSEHRLRVAASAGTAYDGRHIYQIVGAAIQKLDPDTGKVLSSIPAPGEGRDSGLTWAEGKLWVGQYRDRKIVCIDPATGKVLKTVHSDRFVTGVSWVDGELWHGTLEGEESELRQVDADSGTVVTRLRMPAGTLISGLESDGKDTFYCGGARSGKVRAVRRPRQR